MVIAFLAIGIIWLELEPRMPLLWSIAVTGLLTRYHWGYIWDELFDGISNAISMGLSAILIPFVIYMLISSWIYAGTIPWLMYYGLAIRTPDVYLAVAMRLSFVIAFAIVVDDCRFAGYRAGRHRRAAGGAILSGLYPGDEQSPLPDTTDPAGFRDHRHRPPGTRACDDPHDDRRGLFTDICL